MDEQFESVDLIMQVFYFRVAEISFYIAQSENTEMFYCMQIVYINIFIILRNIWKVLRRNENDNRNWAEFQTPPNATHVVFVSSSSTRSAPNTKPVGLYPAHPWAPGRGVGEEGERMNRGWKRLRVTRDVGPKGE